MTSTTEDPRERMVTITMPMRMWDTLPVSLGTEDARARNYTANDHEAESAARRIIAEATPGAEERFALAKAEVDALRPNVFGMLDDIEARFVDMLAWWNSGKREQERSHFGKNWPTMKGGMRSWMMRDVPHAGFTLPEFSFARQYPYFRLTVEEFEAIMERVRRHVEVEDTWNHPTAEHAYSGFSMRFVP